MEQLTGSDADLLVVVADEVSDDDAQRLTHRVYDAVTGLGLATPDGSGIYTEPVRPARLLDARCRGRLDEDPMTFGQRFQLLIDGQPVVGAATLGRLRGAILGWAGSWEYLLAEHRRYAAALQVRYLQQGLAEATGPGSAACEVDRRKLWKVRFARRLALVGFVMLLGEFAAGPNTTLRWEGLLRRTPLERCLLGDPCGRSPWSRTLLASYEAYLAWADAAARSGRALPDDELSGVAVAWDRALVDAVLARRDRWPASFLTRWLC